MYQSIYNMAVDFGLKPAPGYRIKPIKMRIVLDEQGCYQRIEVYEKPQNIFCPDAGFPVSGLTGNNSAVFLTDKAAVVLYDERITKEKKFEKKHVNYVKQIQMGEAVPMLKSISCFLSRFDSDSDLKQQVLEEAGQADIKFDTAVLSFRVSQWNAEMNPEVKAFFDFFMTKKDGEDDAAARIPSVITGKEVVPVSGTFPKVVGGKLGSGFPIYSDSTRSGGERPVSATKSYLGINGCPMSKEEADTIVTGLGFILNEAGQYSPDFNIMWWYDQKTDEKSDLIRKTLWHRGAAAKKKETATEKAAKQLKENRDRSVEYRALLDAAKAGKMPAYINKNTQYHITEISFPGKNRMLSGNEYEGSYQSLYEHLNGWYRDTAIEASFFDTEKRITVYYPRMIRNIHEVLYALDIYSKDGGSDGKYHMFRKEKMDLLWSVYKGTQLPEKFFRMASDQMSRYACGLKKPEYGSDNCLLCLEKAYLIRGGYEMEQSLTPENKSVGYQCGRWLAAADQLEHEYAAQTGKHTSTLSAKFYRQAKKNPAKAFAFLNNLVQLYDTGLTKAKPGANVRYDRLFGEISEQIGEYFPDRLSATEQGAFDLGYAQQRQAFYKKKAADGTDAVDAEKDTDEE